MEDYNDLVAYITGKTFTYKGKQKKPTQTEISLLNELVKVSQKPLEYWLSFYTIISNNEKQ